MQAQPRQTVDTPWGKGTLLPSLRQSREIATQQSRGIQILQRHATNVASFTYEHPDEGDDPTEDRFMLRDLSLSKRIAETVEQKFPLARFMLDIRIETEQGIVEVRMKHLMNRHAYICHVADLECDPRLTQLCNGIGELMDRYGFGLSRRNEEGDVLEAIEKHRPWLRAADQTPGGNYQNKRI